MLDWFTENSLPPLIGGSFLAIAFFLLAFLYYNKTMFKIGLLIALITATIVMIETFIVTDKEKIVQIVYDLAKAVEKNQVDQVLKHVAPSRQDARQRIQQEMPEYIFDSCRVLGIKSFELKNNQRQAEIVFVVYASGAHQQFGKGNAHRRITLMFEKQADDSWKLIDYSHEAPTTGYRL